MPAAIDLSAVPSDFVVTTRPAIRRFISLWVLGMAIGLDWMVAAKVDPLAGAPLPIRFAAAAAVIYVLCSWIAYAVRLHTVVRIDATGLRIERRFPPLWRTYRWDDVLEWRAKRRGRGPSALRLTFADGNRVTVFPSTAINGKWLLLTLAVRRSATAIGGAG